MFRKLPGRSHLLEKFDLSIGTLAGAMAIAALWSRKEPKIEELISEEVLLCYLISSPEHRC
jgi:hypothetical protein